MKSRFPDSLVAFRIGEQEFAVGVPVVERVVRAVQIAPLPGAPRGIRGIIDVQGEIVPVFDLRSRFGQPEREVRESDHLIVAHAGARTVALLVDSVSGVVPRETIEVTPTADFLPDLEGVTGVMKGRDGFVLVHDLEKLLSLEDDAALDRALARES